MAFSIATFNVKNLLPPTSERERAVLPEKLSFIAAALTECDADVVGLEEVGSAELVGAAIERMRPGLGYGEPWMGPADARGIRCALLSRLPVLTARVHTASALPFPAFVAGDPSPFGARLPLRRGVVHLRVEAPGTGVVDVMVVHFKSPRAVAERDPSGNNKEREGLAQASPRARDSRSPASPQPGRKQDGRSPASPEPGRKQGEGALRSLVWRAAEALHVRGLVDDVLASSGAGGRAHVAVVGDMNDTPDSPVLRTLLASGEGALFDCTSVIDASARFSILHEGRRHQVDHVLATSALFERLEIARFLNAALRDHGQPGKTDADAMTIDSDHAALVARFR